MAVFETPLPLLDPLESKVVDRLIDHHLTVKEAVNARGSNASHDAQATA